MIFNTNNCHIFVKHSSTSVFSYFQWNGKTEVLWNKYQIKESDFRTKTMSFTSPQYIDLTTGVYCVLISSPYHENFSGVILSNDYDENTGLYSYQCQDWSRFYQSKFEAILFKQTIYHTLRYLITRGGLSGTKVHTSKNLKNWKNTISGLRNIELYDQKLLGNIVNTNPMKTKPQIIIRDKSYIEAIRDLTFGTIGYVDVWFNDKGIIQIEPLSRNDWYNTGLVLSTDEIMNRKFKFDTTNAITGAIVNGTGYSGGKYYSSTDLIGLDLSAFFGNISSSIGGSNETTTISNKSTTNSVKTTNTKKTTTSKNGNPYNNKKKNILVCADGGSSGFRSSIIKLLKKDGWNVTDLGTGPGTHSTSYNRLSSKYAVNLTIYNGADPATIAEPVTGWLKGKHEKYGVQLVQMFDTSSWTNPNGMKPYRYGDFSGYHCKKAWDDNYSHGKVDINNLGAWYKQHLKQVIHCCGPSPSEAYQQFKAGGYFAFKNEKSTSSTAKNTSKNNSSFNNTLNNTLLNKANSSNKIFEHARDYLSCKLTLPLGNPALKKVHTNQFLFTALPVEFDLANWTILAQKLSSSYNRYSGANYVNNRWYIEGLTIDVDIKGTAKMEFELNAFASSTSKFSEEYRNFTKAYTDAGNKSSSNNSSTKKTSNSVSNGNNTTLKGGQGSTIDNLVKKIIGNQTDPLKKAKLIHEWLRQNVRYSYYECVKYGNAENCYKHRGGLNCADTATLTCAMMLSAGLKAYVVHRTSCGGHFWCVIEINGKKYASDQTGNGSAWNTVWRSDGCGGRTGNGGYTSWNIKCGAKAYC